MTRLALFIVFALVACSKPALVAPSSPPHNQAVDYAHMLSATAPCLALPNATPTLAPDVAWCAFGKVLVDCTAGAGASPECNAFADLRPQPPKQPEPPAKDEKKPEPPIATTATPAASSPPKPESKPPAKK